jgi:hypothetical protein
MSSDTLMESMEKLKNTYYSSEQKNANETDGLMESMEKLKNTFYNSNGKNTFFKKNQKLDCAKTLCETLNLDEMIAKTMYIIPGTNKIVFQYILFKMYAHPDYYEKIVSYILHLYDVVLSVHPNIQVHVLLDSFTVSAAERYKDCISIFCKKCMNSATRYSKLIEKMYIYNTPSMVENISLIIKPFIDPNVGQCVVLYSKAESPAMLKSLFGCV